MKIGLFGIGSGICSEPEIIKEIVQQAEEDGLESVWKDRAQSLYFS